MSAVGVKPSDVAAIATKREKGRRAEVARQEARRRESDIGRSQFEEYYQGYQARTEERRRQSKELKALGIDRTFYVNALLNGLSHKEAISAWFLETLSSHGVSKENVSDVQLMGVDARYYKNAVVDEHRTHEETITNWFVKVLREKRISEEEIREALTAFKDCNEPHQKMSAYATLRTDTTSGINYSHADLLEMIKV